MSEIVWDWVSLFMGLSVLMVFFYLFCRLVFLFTSFAIYSWRKYKDETTKTDNKKW